MRTRSPQGASLFLVATVSIIIILVGFGLFFLMQQFGGFREFQHATDAGSLNIAKEALKYPSYSINSPYQLDFLALEDPNAGTGTAMDLLTYDRVVGQAYLASINALADRPQGSPNGAPSSTGLANAALVAQAANGGTTGNPGVGQSLYNLFAVKNSSNVLYQKFFGNVANSNSTRMLGSDGQLSTNFTGWDISFMGGPTTAGGQGDPTNVWVSMDNNTTNLPYIGDTTTRASDPSSPLYTTITGTVSNQATTPNLLPNNAFYLAGYTAMNFSGDGTNWTLYGVPVYPSGQPHHVSARDFYAAQSQYGSTFAPGGNGIVPPNAYKTMAGSTDKSTTGQGGMEAYSIVGVQNQVYQAQMPNGFIVVYNPPGQLSNGQPMPDSVFNNELMPPGIFVAQTSSGGAAFSTDQNLLTQWANYNANPTGVAPPTTDSSGNSIYFTNNGDNTNNISPAQNGSPVPYQGITNCQWTDVSAPTGNSTCENLLSNFQSTYGSQTMFPPSNPQTPQLMAVEVYKQSVANAFNNQPVSINCPAANSPGVNPSGLRLWVQPGNSRVASGGNVGAAARTVPNPSPGPYDGSPSTSLGTWTSNVSVGSNNPGNYTIYTPDISVPGTLAQLLAQVYSLLTPGGNLSAADISALSSSPAVLQLAQRMQEIDPTTTQAQAINWLLSLQTPIPMGSVYYIWHQTSTPGINGWQFTSTANPPPGLHTTITPNIPGFGTPTVPDGSVQTYFQSNGSNPNPYPTIGYTVNPPFDYSIHEQFYTAFNGALDPPGCCSGVASGTDAAYWQPSSGYQNVLGQLTFANFCGVSGQSSGGSFSAPD